MRPLVYLLSAFVLLSCGGSKTEESHSGPDSTTNIRQAVDEPHNDTTKTEDDPGYECIRGAAEPIVNRDVYPNALFKINDDSLTGIETIDFENGEKLKINNWGCEYFVLTFTFETNRFQGDTTDAKFWLDKAIVLMKEVEHGLDSPLDIKGGVIATSKFLQDSAKYNFMDEIVYDDSEIRDFVRLDRVHKIDNNRYAIQVTFAKGPL